MSVIRINQFNAKDGQGDKVREILRSFDSIFKSNAGYESHQVLQSVDDPNQIVVIEVWESIAAHQAAAQRIPVHAFEQVMRLLNGRPSGEYYS